MRRTLGLVTALVALVAAGCGRSEPAPEIKADKPAAQRPGAAIAPARGPVEMIPAPPTGDVQDIVRGELERAQADGHRVLVYVGAKWCEPCQRFHEAAAAGKVNDAFPGLRLIEFDLDRDRDRLTRAGYVSRMIPLFALPRADGTSSGQQIEGSIKGPGAVDQIKPRLQALLEK